MLRVLLIAVFLNAAVGMPLHAAAHLAGGAVSERTAEAALPGTGDDHDEQAGSPCAWCLAYAQACSAPPPALAERPALDRVAPAGWATAIVPAFSAGLWAASPRGPPR